MDAGSDRLRDRVHELELSLRRVCAERDEARAEVERLWEGHATQVTAIRAHLDELERLREVLRFYADLGERAREALGEERYGFGVCVRGDCAEPCGQFGGCVR